MLSNAMTSRVMCRAIVSAGFIVGMGACAHATGGGAGGIPSHDSVAPVATASSPLPIDSVADQDLLRDRAEDAKLQVTLDSLEQKARTADANGASAVDRIKAHGDLLSYYRGIDYDEGIERHGQAIAQLIPKLSAADRDSLAFTLVASFADRAEADGDLGKAEDALALLKDGLTQLSGLPNADQALSAEQARYELVGQHAPSIVASHWTNGPTGSDTMAFAANAPVTIVEMTAWWCPSCHRTYPWLRSIMSRYGNKVHVVLVTNLMGRFHKEQDLTPDVERSKLTAYFMDEKRLGGASLALVDAGLEDSTDANSHAYHLSGIPQVAIIDRDGVVRRVILGWDPHNEAMFDKAVAALM